MTVDAAKVPAANLDQGLSVGLGVDKLGRALMALQTIGVDIGCMHSYREVIGASVVLEKVFHSLALGLDVTEEAVGSMAGVALVVRAPAVAIVQRRQSLTAGILHVLDEMPHGEVTGLAKLHFLRVLQANDVSHGDDKHGEKHQRAHANPLEEAFRQTSLGNNEKKHQHSAGNRRADRETLEPDEDGIDFVREGSHGLHLRKETEKRNQYFNHV